MQFPPDIAEVIARRFEEAKREYPHAISPDGRALLVDGGIGYCCYISPDGDVYFTTMNHDNYEEWTTDRSPEAQIKVLVLGSRTVPELRGLLPIRQPESLDCEPCGGKGFLHGLFICNDCCGLGWLAAS